jgi:hypothetical protein
MRVRFTSAAEAEVAEALDWYEENGPRQAGRFLCRTTFAVRGSRATPTAFFLSSAPMTSRCLPAATQPQPGPLAGSAMTLHPSVLSRILL